ncbi:MAG: aryl-sulfate sulfotransferase [Phenylobacterium zucineum]|nr:MAG: aryl-sulfate sulfotransferase [Phenylobacterium zucineum]
MPRLRKRSILLAGHATSVALETEFWTVLEAMAKAENLSLAGLIARIDQGRGETPLASASRLAALAFASRR